VVSEVSPNSEYRYVDFTQPVGAQSGDLMQNMKQGCVDLMSGLLPGADKELTAFVYAVQKLFGSEQARQAGDDWIEELEVMDWPAGEGTPEWRRITIAAATRLASRINAPEFNVTAVFSRFFYPGASATD
jgi:hypothetical protein